MAESEQARSEQATPFKLREAQKRGTVAKSADVLTVAAVLALALVAALSGRGIVQSEAAVARTFLSAAGVVDLEGPGLIELLGMIGYASFKPLVPLFVLVLAAGVIANVAQTGPVFSTHPLKPDVQRLNPAAGLKRLFSPRMLIEALKSLIKLALLGWLCYAAIGGFAASHLGLGQADPRSYVKVFIDTATRLIAYFLPALALIALLDYLYTRWEYLRRMMMSRRELREELKQREGDPRIRARSRELRREMLKRGRSLARVKDADVLITNPTHLAVALLYRRGDMAAPQVIAKGAGELAARMLTEAHRYRVPIVRNPPLARKLFKHTELERSIGPEVFPDVARVLAWVFVRRDALTMGRA